MALQLIQSLIQLRDYTTWKVGGPAERFAEPKTIEEVKELINWAKVNQYPCQVIGAGSNLLITDNTLKGLTLCMKKLQGSNINSQDGTIQALCGEPIPALARRAAKAGLHGLEWSVGIPGTIGGAAVMNAGAQGNCIADKLHSIEVISIKGGEPFVLTQKELNFSYRQSMLQSEQLIVLSVRLNLEPGHSKEKVARDTNKNLAHRLKTQPYNQPTCGSVFRNPEPLKAGKMIESLGLKGFRLGGAEISKTHANFIVNSKNAKAKEIATLISVIQNKVEKAYGVLLHPEVKRMGL